MEVVKYCQSAFNFVIPSVQIAQKSENLVYCVFGPGRLFQKATLVLQLVQRQKMLVVKVWYYGSCPDTSNAVLRFIMVLAALTGVAGSVVPLLLSLTSDNLITFSRCRHRIASLSGQ